MKSKFLLTILTLALTAASTFAATGAATPEDSVRESKLAAEDAAAQVKAEITKARATLSEAQSKVRAEADMARAAADKAKAEAEKTWTTNYGKVATGPVTFLGVMTAPAPSSLTTQLDRPAGMGLVVVSVQAKSPAEDVLKVDDLLVRLDDQKLINNDQLTALIRGRQEGEEVTLTYVRGGKEATAKVRLAKQSAMAGKPVVMTLTKITGQPNEETKYELQTANEWKIGSSIQGKTTIENGGLNQTFTYTGGAGITEIKVVDGKKTVTTRSSGGSIEFSGPYDTEEDRKAAPASVQTRVADAESRINAVLQVKPPTKVPAPAPAPAMKPVPAIPVAPQTVPAPGEVR